MLSKSDFLLFLEAPMHLWAKTHNQLQQKPLSPYEQHLMLQGQEVEALAREYIETNLLPNYSDAQLLWQPTYHDNQFEIRADALIWDKTGDYYDLYEIKSSTAVRTDHEYDLTFQLLLLESFLNICHVFIVHINKDYQYSGEIDIGQFFSVEEVSEKIEKRRENVLALRQAAMQVPLVPLPKPSFACTKPQSCPCPNLCHPNLPENPIYNIPYIGKKARTLREMGITDINAIPVDFPLNDKQQRHVQAVKEAKPLIDKDSIRDALAILEYPLYFLDYETFNPAIPLFPGYRPYEHIVFQYSLHVIREPGSDPQHFECLITDKIDPAPMIVRDLLDHLGDSGSIIVWNQSFEAHRNQDLAGHCESFSPQLDRINDRLFDLMKIFKDGHYIHPDFHGSASLKAVLPVLCPEYRYENLQITNGEETMMTWYWLQTGDLDADTLDETKAAMKAYCELDTYAMVAIFHHLQKTIRRSNEP
ncbi:MAG TPA: hypothetical protein DCL08_02395 [Anaerolineaceae bacterium]|nr:hypothetical protein [Anaerolineaceae bacterium]